MTSLPAGWQLPKGWTMKTAGDVATLQRGFDLPVQDRQEGDVPILAANGPIGTHSVYKVKGPGVVTGRSGSLGSVHFVEDDFWPLNTALWVKDFHGNDPKWVSRLLRWMRLEQYTRGVGVPTLNRNLVHEVEIPVPPLDEQKWIAAILDQADELRRKRQRAIDRLNQLGQAIFHEMFGDLFRSKHAMVELGEVCDVRDGTHDSPKYVEDGHPLLTSKNFSGGRIDYDGAKLISPEDFIKINKRSDVKQGDIVMPMIGTIGSPVIVDFEPDFAIKNVALIKFQGSRMNAEFVREVLDSSLFKVHVANKGRGGTQQFVSLGDIRKFLIPNPGLEHQQAFADRVKILNGEVQKFRISLKQTEVLFASLQHRAFQGEL